MRFSVILVSACLTGGLLGGCGGSTSGGGGSGPVPQSQFAGRFESAVCDNIGSCCKSSGYTYDAAKCKQALDQSIVQIFTSGSATYNAQAAGTCLDSVSAAMSACKGFDGVSADACQKVFTGTKATGQPCSSDTDCAPVAGSEVNCDYAGTGNGGSSGSGQGVCTAQPIGKKGDGCDTTCTKGSNYTECSGGAPISGTGGSGGGGPIGNAICYTNDGLYCGDNGVCDALIPVGQSCNYSGCVLDAFCDGGTCVAKLPAGSPCSSYDACKDGEYCAGIAAAGSGTCANLKPDGAPCTGSDECQNFSSCDNGKCTPSSFTGISPALCSGQMKGGSGGTGGVTGGGSGGSMGGAFNGSGGTGGGA